MVLYFALCVLLAVMPVDALFRHSGQEERNVGAEVIDQNVSGPVDALLNFVSQRNGQSFLASMAGAESANASVAGQRSDANITATQLSLKAHVPQEPPSSPMPSRICPAGTPRCKTMCRWLKLVDDDGEPDTQHAHPIVHKNCRLVEQTLVAFGYVLPEPQQGARREEPMDCIVNTLRTDVLPADVPVYISYLEGCVGSLPKRSAETYHISLALLNREISEWHREHSMKVDVTQEKRELQLAVSNGRAVWSARSHGANVSGAISDLRSALVNSEKIRGHYLIEDVRAARETLEQLEPIPPALQALREATQLAEKAERAAALTEEAITWLNVSVVQAEELDLGQPVINARMYLKQLVQLRSAEVMLRLAVLHGNASIVSKTDLDDSMHQLNRSIVRARAVNLTMGANTAAEILAKLKVIEAARDELHAAADNAIEVLKTNANETEAISRLSHAMSACAEESVCSWARPTELLDKLQEVHAARSMLEQAERRGQRALAENATLDSLNSMERVELDKSHANVTLNLAAAIAHAEELGLTSVTPPAQKVLRALRQRKNLRDAQEALLIATSAGRIAMHTLSKLDDAAVLLVAAIRKGENTRTDVGEARELLTAVQALGPAREELDAAIAQANVTLITAKGSQPALIRLKNSIDQVAHLQHDDYSARVEEGRSLFARLTELKAARVSLDAAIYGGQISLKTEAGEVAAITRLRRALKMAEKERIHVGMSTAVELIDELRLMDADKEKLEASIMP